MQQQRRSQWHGQIADRLAEAIENGRQPEAPEIAISQQGILKAGRCPGLDVVDKRVKDGKDSGTLSISWTDALVHCRGHVP